MTDVNSMYADAERLKDEGQLEQAIEKLNEILKIDPDHVLSHLALAVAHGRIGEHEKAVKHGEQACALEPSEAFNFTALSVTYQRAWQGTQKQEYIARAEDAMAKAHAIQGTAGH